MANGTAATALLPLPEIPHLQLVGDPSGVVKVEDWVAWIEPIVVALVDVCFNAVREIEVGGLGPLTRSQGGELVGALTVIREKLGARAFAAAVHRVRPRRSTPMNAGVADDIIAVITELATQTAAMN